VSAHQRRTEVIRYWWSKSEESLLSAEREIEAGSLEFAINRIYYAVFYAVSAALLEQKASFKKHSGVRVAFHRKFIKSGLLDIQWGKFYDTIFEDRQEGDYIALIEFERDYVKSQLNQAREFLTRLRPFISSLSNE
jgi:uncharacterized protein